MTGQRNRLDDQPVERSLAYRAYHDSAKPRLLECGGLFQQFATRPLASRDNTFAGQSAQVIEAPVQLGQRQARLAGSFDRATDDGGIAYANLALADPAGQQGHGNDQFVAGKTPQHVSEHVALLTAGARARQRL